MQIDTDSETQTLLGVHVRGSLSNSNTNCLIIHSSFSHTKMPKAKAADYWLNDGEKTSTTTKKNHTGVNFCLIINNLGLSVRPYSDDDQTHGHSQLSMSRMLGKVEV